MRLTRWSKLSRLCLGLVWLGGCASAPKRIYTHEELEIELDARVSTQMRNEIVIPFEIDDEIRELAHKVTKLATTDSEKIQALVDTIIGLDGFSISYDWLSNKTAREVYRQGKGNCVAYSNLFVGMAREVGLEAVYADVTSVERISREAEIVVNSTHVTAAVNREGASTTLIDFGRDPERLYVGSRLMDDLEAIAHFYNNQGFLYGYFTEGKPEELGFDPAEKELEMYRLALEVVPDFARARNNLGVALRRRGRIDEAIEQYKRVVETTPDFAAAHSNLGSAYLQQGRTEEALAAFRRASKHAGRNGFIHYRLGHLYLTLGRHEDAIEQLRKALSKQPQLADARYDLGECYRELGQEEKAIKEYETALEIDPNHLAAKKSLDRLSRSERSSR